MQGASFDKLRINSILKKDERCRCDEEGATLGTPARR